MRAPYNKILFMPCCCRAVCAHIMEPFAIIMRSLTKLETFIAVSARAVLNCVIIIHSHTAAVAEEQNSLSLRRWIFAHNDKRYIIALLRIRLHLLMLAAQICVRYWRCSLLRSSSVWVFSEHAHGLIISVFLIAEQLLTKMLPCSANHFHTTTCASFCWAKYCKVMSTGNDPLI